MTGIRAAQLDVRGNATPEEIAAVVASLNQRLDACRPSRYERWRAARIAAVRIARAH